MPGPPMRGESPATDDGRSRLTSEQGELLTRGRLPSGLELLKHAAVDLAQRDGDPARACFSELAPGQCSQWPSAGPSVTVPSSLAPRRRPTVPANAIATHATV
jgi:hypothetical protein